MISGNFTILTTDEEKAKTQLILVFVEQKAIENCYLAIYYIMCKFSFHKLIPICLKLISNAKIKLKCYTYTIRMSFREIGMGLWNKNFCVIQ